MGKKRPARLTDDHHIIPVSIQGPNWIENVITLKRDDHVKLHEILDIPYKHLSRFRKRTNHLLYMDNYYIDELSCIHRLYFGRLPSLPPVIIAHHVKVMEAIVKRSIKEYNIKYIIEIRKHRTGNEEFHYWLGVYHSLLYIKAKQFEKLLPPQKRPGNT